MKNKIRILHIDDDLHNRQIVKNALEKEADEFEVVETENHIELELHLNKNDFDLILSDFNVLGLEGLKVLQLVREKKPETPIIIVTGTGSEEIAVKALKLGAADYVIKSEKHIRNLTPSIRNAIKNKKTQLEQLIALAALRKSEESYHLLFDNNLDGVILLSQEGEILKINNSACNIFRMTEEEIKRIGRNGIVDQTDPRLSAATEEILNTGKFKGELTGLRKNGISFPVEISSSLFLDGGGNQRISTIIRDISESKMADEKLKASEIRYRRLFESAKDGILILDAETGLIIDVNPFLIDLLGYSAEQFRGKKVWEIGSFADLIDNYDKFVELQKKGYVSYNDLPILTSDGKEIAVEFVSNVYEENHKNVVQCNIRDITKRKAAEKSQLQSEEKFRLIMENSADAIFITDQTGKYLYSNKAVTDMLGYSEEEIKQKSITDLTPKNKHYIELFAEVISAGKIFSEIELLKKDGSFIATDLNAVLLPNGLVYGSCRDITKRKETELLLKHNSQEMAMQNEIYQQLNIKLVQTNKELIVAKEKAEESDSLKTSFLQNLSHEIRTPMNGILGFSELLKNLHLKGETQQEYIRLIEHSGHRMLNIINDIINISKIETGQIDLFMHETNVNQIMRHLLTFFEPEAELKGLKLNCKTELSDELSEIETDETKLTQVLSNLLKNGIKFTKTGSIDFGYHLNGKMLEFYVKDTGIGILPEMQDIIFERFRQVEMTISRNYEGMGLGLSISKAFVEKLGGKIWMKSEINKGTTLFFNIPYHSAKISRNETQKIAGTGGRLKQVNILIADDDDISKLLMREMLEIENANLFFANNGKEALDLAKSIPKLNLVLMDLKMPVMDGFEATKLIKEMNPGLPVFAQTAYASLNEIDKAKAAGCDDYLVKPVNRDMLLKMIEKHLVLQ